jgi:hypothetical protein
VNRDEAAAVLRVSTEASIDELRHAYRMRLHEVHPDRGGTAHATAEVVEAYECLKHDTAPLDDADRSSGTVSSRIEQHDAAIDVGGAHEEVFMSVLEALSDHGVVTYIDVASGLIEALIEDVHRLTVTLQGRSSGVEVLFTLESPRPDGAPVLADLASALTADLE